MKHLLFSLFSKRHKKNASPSFCTGFTLVELIVMIAVISVLSAVMFSGNRQNSEQRLMVLEAQKLTQNLRSAASLALSSSQADVCGGVVVAYGVYFDTVSPDQYTLLADCNGNKVYDAGEGTAVVPFDRSALSSLTANSSGVSSLAIIFIPPQPTVAINSDITNINRSAVINICLKGSTLCKTMTVNAKGVISLQ